MCYYWSTHKLYGVDPKISTISRERFQTILKCLHVNDNSKIDKTDNICQLMSPWCYSRVEAASNCITP